MHNANDDAHDGIVNRETRAGNNDWDVLVVPNTVTMIRNGAYENAPNIREIRFENGDAPLTLYERAFARCDNLERVVLPDRIETIQDRCFEGCTSLNSVVINPGIRTLGLGYNIFDGCPKSAALSKKLRDEQDCRRLNLGWEMNAIQQGRLYSADELRELYTTAQSVPHDYFNQYTQSYQDTCERLGQVDWNKASEKELKQLLYVDDNGVTRIDNGTFSFQRVPWRSDDFPFYRQVGSSLVGLDNTTECAGRVSRIRREFYNNLPPRLDETRVELKVVFNRAIATLNPDVVVQVPDQDKLHLLLTWLCSHGMVAPCNFQFDDWFESSAAIRTCFKEYLRGPNQYQLGVFAWILTEALLPNPGRDSRERQEIMRQKMDELAIA